MSFIYAVHTRVVDALTGALSGLSLHRGSVPKTPAYPYVLLTSTFPGVTERSLARSPQKVTHRFRTTIAGTSEQSVFVVAGNVSAALEQRALTVEGWVLSKMEAVPNEQPILPDFDVTLANGMNPFYAVLDWVVTGSKKPTT